MRKKVEITVEHKGDNEDNVMDILTGVCVVYESGWVKMWLQDEEYWIHYNQIKKLRRAIKKVND